MSKALAGKIALITGASRGIGAAIAKRYAQEGAHVILVARTIGGLEEVDDQIKAEGGEATLVPLDLLEFQKIDELGGVIAERFGKLDVLVGNAGMLGELAPVGHIAPKVWEKTMALNVTANYRLIRSFDPLLRVSQAGRAIFVSSKMAKAETAYWGGYAASKAALEAMVATYAEELKETNVRVNTVSPGGVQTKMLQEALPGKNLDDMPTPEDIVDIFVSLASDDVTDSGKVFFAA